MTAHDLLDMIGETREIYILEAQAYREEADQPQPQQRTVSFRKTWLIAAVIALTLLLVGCTVVYVLSLQEMQVGEYTYTEPAHINEAGEQIPAAQKTSALVSLQGIYQPALEEWLAFTDSYDPDHALLAANNRNESGVPEPYYTTYSCYTWEMVDRLDQIIEKYDLKLLEPYIQVQEGEEDILFDALKIDNVHRENAGAQVDYGSGYFYPEGTFSISADITLANSEWNYVNFMSIRYSLKEYFDPVSGSVGDIESYEQWNYTTAGGTTVLLARNEDHARIYANLEDAFVSIQMNAYGYAGRETVPMPKEALQQVADVIDFSVKPQYADLELVEQMMAQIAAQREAEAAAARENEAAMVAGGYENYMAYRLETAENPDDLKYSLYDLNGDGTEELIIRDGGGYCHEVLSRVSGVNDGHTFLYFDAGVVTASSEIHPCEGNTFLLYSGYGDFERYKFYEAGPYAVSYIAGVTYSKEEGIWYYHPDDDPWTDNEEVISEAEALEILDSYKLETLGQPKPAAGFYQSEVQTGADPYAVIITGWLANQEDADNWRYALYDVNGDGVNELLVETARYTNGQPNGTGLSIYSQMNGELVDLNFVMVEYVCEGGYLEHDGSDETGRIYHEYYQMGILGVKLMEMIEYDPLTDTWTQDDDGHWGDRATVITEGNAWSVISSYKRLQLDMKPLSEYPLPQ